VVDRLEAIGLVVVVVGADQRLGARDVVVTLGRQQIAVAVVGVIDTLLGDGVGAGGVGAGQLRDGFVSSAAHSA